MLGVTARPCPVRWPLCVFPKKQKPRTHINNCLTGLSWHNPAIVRDCHGISLRFPENSVHVFPFSPRNKATILTPACSQDNPEKLFVLIFFFFFVPAGLFQQGMLILRKPNVFQVCGFGWVFTTPNYIETLFLQDSWHQPWNVHRLWFGRDLGWASSEGWGFQLPELQAANLAMQRAHALPNDSELDPDSRIRQKAPMPNH